MQASLEYYSMILAKHQTLDDETAIVRKICFSDVDL